MSQSNQPVASRLSILVLSFSPIATDPRVLRQVKRLEQRYDVTTAGFGESSLPGVQHIQILDPPKTTNPRKFASVAAQVCGLQRLSLLLNPTQKDAREKLSVSDWDLVVSNDVLAAPVANHVSSKHGVLVDLHEYAPRQGENNWKWRLVTGRLMKWVLRHEIAMRAAAVTTVGQGIADEYKREFDIDAQVVVNAAPKQALEVGSVGSPIRMVHSGIPGAARKLEVMIDGVRASKADVTLDLYLMQRNFDYLRLLKEHAGDDPRIRFRDPVPYDQLVSTLNQYDIGLTLIAPTTFNLKWCLPNKFFDFVQARLGVVTGPSPEMARYVEKYHFGSVTDDFTADKLTQVLDRLSVEQVNAWKKNSDSVADELSSERQDEVWGEVVARITETSPVEWLSPDEQI